LDITLFKKSLAGLMSQLYVLDVNGLPTTQHMPAQAEAPASLTETDLPTWIFLTRAANYPNPPDQTQGRLAKETRDFDIRLYVTIAQTGIDGEAERDVEKYLDYSRNHIQSHTQLWDGDPAHRVPGLQRGWIVSDSGVAKMVYGSKDNPVYLGISFLLRVEFLNKVIYASNQ
jgi:hypothetical protein